MEVSVSFTGEGETPDPEKYREDRTPIGRIYIPAEGVLISEPARVRYEKHPWIEGFELDGIKAAPAVRKGIGTKGAKGFVTSLSTIYARAYDDYRDYGGDEAFDTAGYFRHAAEYFAGISENPDMAKLYKNFCGFAENMWREGNEEILTTVMEIVLPVIYENKSAAKTFINSVTEEFRGYIAEHTEMEM